MSGTKCVYVAALAPVVAVLLGPGNPFPREATAAAGPVSEVPKFEVDATWPKPSVKRLILILSLAILGSAVPAWAQLADPNEAGVAMGHVHLNVRDVEAEKNFWIAVGGTPFKRDPYIVMKFPGVLVIIGLRPPFNPPTGGSEGSVVNHIGFRVPNLAESVAKWNAAGLKVVPGRTPAQAFLYTTDNLKVEILEDPSLTLPIAFHHIHFWVEDSASGVDSVPEIKAWYVKMFGAKPGNRGKNEAADLPGANLSFSKSPTPVVGTQGRVLDHIGFEIKDLQAYCKKMEASGVKFDRAYHVSPLGIGGAFLTDLWGTRIELNEGMNRW